MIETNPRIGKSCIDQNHAKLLLQPRVGLAWDPTGRGTWAVRAAFGIHNDLLDNLGIRVQPNPPFSAREQLTVTNGFLPLLPLKKNDPLPPTCGPGISQPCSIYQPAGFDPNMFTPTAQIWDLTVERQLARDLMLSVGYVGSQSYHTNLTMDSNTAPPEVCQTRRDAEAAACSQPVRRLMFRRGPSTCRPGRRSWSTASPSSSARTHMCPTTRHGLVGVPPAIMR